MLQTIDTEVFMPHPALVDMEGRTVGRLKVLRRHTDPAYKIGGARWLCLCSCGTEVVVKGSQLRTWEAHKHSACCKNCRVPKRGPRLYKPRRQRSSKYCKLCENMSFRVQGEVCARCGRPYAPERIPRAHELAQHKYDRVP